MLHNDNETYIIKDLLPYEAAIVMLYFSFTTVMTIGFGDYTPRSNYERALASFCMLTGVIAFTLIKDHFTEIYNFIVELNSSMEEREELAVFF